MAYDDQFGNHHTASYWIVAQTNVGWLDRTILVSFYGYKDQASYVAGKQSIGQRTYAAAGADFDLYRQQYESQTPRPDIRDMAYMVAMNTKDVVVDPTDPTKNVSFFESATDVP